MSGAGHNSAVGHLRAFIERVERIEEEIKSLNADKSEIYKEARSMGFDVKTMRKVVAARKVEPADREEADALFDLYWSQLHGTGTEDATRVHVHEESVADGSGSSSGRTSGFGPDNGGSNPSPETTALVAQRIEHSVPDREVAGSNPAERANPDEDFEPPSFLAREAKPLRPLCQHPEKCAGYGSKTCHACLKAAGVGYGSAA
jgi:uncharacterized protein (UPF0335 family)